jgi:hypothetical protein
MPLVRNGLCGCVLFGRCSRNQNTTFIITHPLFLKPAVVTSHTLSRTTPPMNSEPVKRKSSRVEQCRVKAEKKLKEDLLAKQAAIVSFVDKKQDGLELRRRERSLKARIKFVGDYPGEGSVYLCAPKEEVKVRESVNQRKEIARKGGLPCYDVMDNLGSSIYGYSIPVSLMAGLLLGCKSPASVESFKTQAKQLDSHRGTNYMFLHWLGRGEKKRGDYKLHNFVTNRPSLLNSIESFGNYISKEILLNEDLGQVKQPGLLSNTKLMVTLDYQPPHWDFIGWRDVKAHDMPWVVHVPLCREGMMLHVWPTERDEATHSSNLENFKIGQPKLVHIAFGDYLILRADVCHGGCFGSKGNMRFHMVLRKEKCKLDTLHLHHLEHSICKEGVPGYKAKAEDLSQLLGQSGAYFSTEASKKCKTVTPYVTNLKKVYPCLNDWCGEGLLGPLAYD